MGDIKRWIFFWPGLTSWASEFRVVGVRMIVGVSSLIPQSQMPFEKNQFFSEEKIFLLLLKRNKVTLDCIFIDCMLNLCLLSKFCLLDGDFEDIIKHKS
jgi:hypothetical protein